MFRKYTYRVFIAMSAQAFAQLVSLLLCRHTFLADETVFRPERYKWSAFVAQIYL